MSGNPLGRLVQFLRQGVWDLDFRRLRPWPRAGVGALRVSLHVVRSVRQNLVGLTAAGLTLVSALALVPMLGLVMALAKALGYGADLDRWLVQLGQELPADLAEQLRAMVLGVNFGTLGAVGSAFVVWSGLVLFTRVEQALNGIWRAGKARPWLRRVSDFVALLVLVPPLFVLALVGSSVLRSAQFIEPLQSVPGLSWVHAAGLGLVPHLLLWVAFGALYMFMPSARVRIVPALSGGVVAGSSLIVLHGIYLRFQIGVAQANAIYATLAALPLLLIYLQLLWTVVLVGAEVSYAVQNLGSLRSGDELPAASHGVRQRVMWHLLRAAADAFRSGRKGARLADVASELDVPRQWIDDGADPLVEAGLLVAARGDDDLLLPGRPPETITMADVLGVLAERNDPLAQRVSLPPEQEQRLARALDAAQREVAGVAL